MFKNLALMALLLTGIALADDLSDYDNLKTRINEQRRVLRELHSNRQYSEAIQMQEAIAKLSNQALELALKSPEIDAPGAWKYHANTLREVGYTEEALQAVDAFMQTPLLKRNDFREGWTRRAEIHKRARDYQKAQDCYRQALQYSETPNEKFQIIKNQAELELKEAKPDRALERVKEAQVYLPELEPQRRTQAERTLQWLLVKIHKEAGNADAARAAKFKELELRKQILEQEIERFDADYPPSSSSSSS